jgi:uncharacterized protein DUF4013
VRLVAESFAWPFRGSWRSAWVAGVVMVLFLPLLFIPLLGYAVAATRAAERDPSQGPPPFQLSARLLADGLWTSFAVMLVALPFALAWNPFASTLHALGEPNAHVIAFLALALPWGLVSLLLMPHSTAVFAATGSPRDMFDVAAALRRLGRDFMTWNVVAAAMVTGWAIGLACAGLLCVGIVPGVFYAILVSAHAAAALPCQGPRPSAG